MKWSWRVYYMYVPFAVLCIFWTCLNSMDPNLFWSLLIRIKPVRIHTETRKSDPIRTFYIYKLANCTYE